MLVFAIRGVRAPWQRALLIRANTKPLGILNGLPLHTVTPEAEVHFAKNQYFDRFRLLLATAYVSNRVRVLVLKDVACKFH